MKKIIIAGGRDFDDYEFLAAKVDLVLAEERSYYYGESEYANYRDVEIVSGGASGADRLGEIFAEENNLPIKKFKADWDTYGKSAGPLRNEEMSKYSNVLISFWDGMSRGTKNMIETALKDGLEIHVFRYNKK